MGIASRSYYDSQNKITGFGWGPDLKCKLRATNTTQTQGSYVLLQRSETGGIPKTFVCRIPPFV